MGFCKDDAASMDFKGCFSILALGWPYGRFAKGVKVRAFSLEGAELGNSGGKVPGIHVKWVYAGFVQKGEGGDSL